MYIYIRIYVRMHVFEVGLCQPLSVSIEMDNDVTV